MREFTMEEIEKGKMFEEAKTRYEACNSNRWKNQWWEVICNIWKTTTKYVKMYFLDMVNKVVRRVGELINTVDIQYTYWIRLYDANHKTVWDKIGTSKDPIHRWESILKERYCALNNIIGYEVKGLWEIKDQWPQGLESYLRSMLIKSYGKYYVPNDRFAYEFDDSDILPLAEFYLA